MEWQKNLYHHEENPPENAWEQIASQLEVQPWNLRKNLLDDEVLPPPAAWNNITAQLDPESPFQEERRIIPFWKKPAGAVAAAAVGVLILLSAYYFLARKDLIRATDIAASVIDSPKKPAGSKTSDNKVANSEPAQKENENQPEQKERSNNLPVRQEPLVVAASEQNAKRSYSPHPFAVQSVERYPKSAHYSYNIYTLNRYINATNRNITAFQKGMNPPYVIVQNEYGQSVRVSSKLKDIITYLQSGDQDYNDTDLPVSEIDYWKKMFSDWKKKADRSGYIPDSENFFDIMGFIKMLQENNN